jgi:hypothetical protein
MAYCLLNLRRVDWVGPRLAAIMNDPVIRAIGIIH